jgi:response regulator of citrate/malate metabolism
MKRMVRLYKDTYLKMDKKILVDSQTGEIVNVRNASIIKREEVEKIQFNSTFYNYIDTHSLKNVLNNNLKQVDLALLLTMSSNLLMNYNICLDGKDNPLTADSIAQTTGQSRQSTKRKINSLISHGLLFYGVYRLI